MSRLNMPEAIELSQLHLPALEEIHNPHYQEYLTLTQRRWMFSDLLMMNKEKTILTNYEQKIKTLNLLYHCYQSMAEALHAFYIQRKPELFDAQVGESACQIRAIQLAVMLKAINLKTSTAALEKSQKFRANALKVFDVMEQYKIPHNQPEGPIYLNHFLQKYQLDMPLDSSDIFLLCCFILSEFKKRTAIDKQIMDTALLSSTWNISSKQANNFVRYLQRNCSYLSIDFLFNNVCSDVIDKKLACYQIQVDSLGRWLLPSLITIEWMLSLMEAYKIDAKLEVFMEESNNQFIPRYHFLCADNVFYFEDELPDHINLNQLMPVIKIEAFVHKNNLTRSPSLLCKRLNQLGLKYIVKINTASHPAYPSYTLDHLNDNPYQSLSHYFSNDWLNEKLRALRDMQASAMIDGLCKSYPHTLAIAHIACATV